MNAKIRKSLETSLRGLVALSFFTALAVASARAQSRDAHFISARAGVVNYVSGDAVRTGADGRVEVLLNPGSYFRAGASTEFELTDASLDNLRLRLARGAA